MADGAGEWIADGAALPLAADAEAAETCWRRWREAAEEAQAAEDDSLHAFMLAAADGANHQASGRLLSSVFANSPYLSHSLISDSGFARLLLEAGPDAAYRAARDEAADRTGFAAESLADVMGRLRRAKRRAALAIALGDIAGVWTLERVTGALSDFAETALGAAFRHLLRGLHDAGELALPEPDDPERDSGLFALGMGKLGARELNYSSDIDLILFYDQDRTPYVGRRGLQPAFTRLAQGLMRIMGQQTAQGYVFRTDLRLRPDPGSTPPAVSVRSAAFYYRNAGRNWERAAMIKARPVAGDIEAGGMFLEGLQPFVWRRHLDFAAAQDIRAIKEQIDASRGAGRETLEGHNVKLGRGGIREIEFFVQAQQLLWGGRDPALRSCGTLEALEALVSAGHVNPGAAAELNAAYGFLRRVEHRLQMVDDRQTHSLPESADGLAGIAAFLAFAATGAFAEQLNGHIAAVERHYGALFEDPLDTPDAEGIDFSAEEEGEAALAGMGYGDGGRSAEIVRRWLAGRVPVLRRDDARALLARLLPNILTALAGTPDPDAALSRFDRFLAGLPPDRRLLSLLAARPELLAIVMEVAGAAPLLAARLTRRPLLLESALSRDFTDLDLPDEEGLEPEIAEAARRGLVRLFYAREFGRAEMQAELEAVAGRADDLPDLLDVVRRWVNDRLFQIGAHLLRGRLSPEEAGPPLVNIAEACIGVLMPAVQEAFAAVHGHPPGGRTALLALGALGGREMTVNSDLDLMLLYEHEGATSDGPQPLDPDIYYVRLCRRLTTALTAETAEGGLYRLDMQTRDTGSHGPLACSLQAFLDYPHDRASAPALAALGRARVVWSEGGLGERFEAAQRDIFAAPRPAERLAAGLATMRGRKTESDNGLRHIEHRAGGRRDVLAAADFLRLLHAAERPDLLQGDAAAVFGTAQTLGSIGAKAAEDLAEAARLWRNLWGLAQLAAEEERAHTSVEPVGVIGLSGGKLVFEALAQSVEEVAARAANHVDMLFVGEP
ncbi:MAG: bifunctional [glutamate--ammonia ligase]-adenylyl-L-tyrosine phosphorylase/[glutamate--ammonia-ligase] adenylyltransferase [Alphaproteobacteria bacterium]|nr:bifunctional [glutamate--ammonia ligase]-adenylyl-L-tyrosine phosphorylase/[glutamate--ammonia-ligase] adenylyltransferase [Alphaproteobacteria bacterium]